MSVSKESKSKLFEDLKKFRFQKQNTPGNSRSGHEISDSDSNSRGTSSANSTPSKTSHRSSSNTDSPPKGSNGIARAHSLSASDSDSEHPSREDRSREQSRIKALEEFKFRRRLKNAQNAKKCDEGTKPTSDTGEPSKKSRIRNRADLENSGDESPVKLESSRGPRNRKRIKQPTSSDDEEENCQKKRKKSGKRISEKTGSDESDIWSDSVLNDDSEDEVTDDMSATKLKVFDFLNSATPNELLQVNHCSERKVNAVIENRPYLGWKDVVFKFENMKQLNVQLLNWILEFLKSRDTVSRLMKKCLKLAISTEEKILEGDSRLQEQPPILEPSLRLKSYQMVGLNWLSVMHSQGLNPILADEMGLGKTIQVISFLAHLKERGLSSTPHLIVAPTSTLDNWAIEFVRWCPSMRVVTYHGSAEDRRELRYQWFKEKFKSMDVIVTTYQIVVSNNSDRKMFKVAPIHYVVFDEAHMLKNMNTVRYQHLFNIKAKHRILLTGTPLQNNLLELMSLLNFVMPNVFSDKILCIRSFFSKINKSDESKFEQGQVDLAKRIMKPFVLRRLKADVLRDLPAKTSRVILCPMHEAQKKKYNKLQKAVAEAARTNDSNYNYLSSFMQLRKLANHPLTHRYLYKEEKLIDIAERLSFDSTYQETNKSYILDDLNAMSDHEIHKLALEYKCLSRFKLDDSYFLQSGKLQELDSLLPKLKAGGHRVLLFSQFLMVLDIMEEYLRIREHSFLRLDGSTNTLDRQELIDDFNDDSDIFVFLLSTRAGGMGINLTSADIVIIHDIDFNPYNDKQAEDRCHRLGQTRPVEIIRLVSQNTVEEKIHAQAQLKLELEQELTGQEDDESVNSKNVELLLKEALGLIK